MEAIWGVNKNLIATLWEVVNDCAKEGDSAIIRPQEVRRADGACFSFPGGTRRRLQRLFVAIAAGVAGADAGPDFVRLH